MRRPKVVLMASSDILLVEGNWLRVSLFLGEACDLVLAFVDRGSFVFKMEILLAHSPNSGESNFARVNAHCS